MLYNGVTPSHSSKRRFPNPPVVKEAGTLPEILVQFIVIEL
jgi:hypothetical protein